METPAVSATPAALTCTLTPAELKQALGNMVGPGEIVIDTSYSGYRCSYTIREGSLPNPGAGGFNSTGGDSASFVIDTHRYADNATVGVATTGVNTSFGGSNAVEFTSSAYQAWRASAAANKGEAGAAAVVENPMIGAGVISDNEGGFILATRGDYWFQAQVSNTKWNSEYQPNIMKAAELLASKY